MKIILLMLSTVILFGCTDKNSPNINNPQSGTEDYAAGEVLTALKDSITLEEYANYIYSMKNISINNIVAFNYYSTLPKDSMQVIISTLESRSYVWKGQSTFAYNDSTSELNIVLWIKDFNPPDIQDWELLKSRFSMFHIPSHFQVGQVNVSPGEETEWINILSKSSLFYAVELNYKTYAF